MKQKKLLLVASYNRSIILFRKDLLLEFKRNGFEVLAVAPNDSAHVGPELEKMGIRYGIVPMARTGFNPLQDVIYFINLVRVIRKFKPSIIIPYTVKPVVYGCLAAKLFSKARVFPLITGLGYIETAGGGVVKKMIRRIMFLLYKISLTSITGIFFQNREDKDYFFHHGLLNVNTKYVVVNGSGVNLEHYGKAPAVKNPIRFLLVARLIRAKGVSLFMEAAKHLKATYRDIEFHLIGQLDEHNPDAISREEIQQGVDAGVIVFHGFQNNIVEWLRQSSVFVLPSYYREGIPRTILEAMAVGKPIITTDNTGCRETVMEGVNGFLIPKNSLQPLIEAMEKFVREPERIEIMGEASFVLAQERFDVKKVNQEMMKFMEVV